MIKHAIALVSLMSVLAGQAAAADLAAVPYAAATAAAPWTGFHVGVVAGGGRGTANHDYPTLPLIGTSGDFGQTGWIGGATAGYEWQFGTFVVGVEGDLSAANIDGNTSNGFCAGTPCRTKITWLHTGRARVGVALGDVMPYVTGGVAVAGLKSWNKFNPTNSEPNAIWSGVVGGGVEWSFLPNWSAKAEYLFVPSFTTATSTDLPDAKVNERNVSLVRFGVNYHLGDAPLRARY
ncbi:outer membrane protein [Bradyrhizobium sp. BR 10261]|uniref:outer membrane protein n=1 Tax=Bradyrhizobium sp. BR 10261 TaxID=2749992 RepID=UPI001C64B87B|nr:outer membrane beta-barrel protein [Bradyrhizobium sp. BR 10261]MBW7963465.1 porin family protein [Bradyrhizobium sp. BR 10261]